MSPLDSPVVRQGPLPITDERLIENSVEDSSPLQRGILYTGLASLFLWTVIILVLALVF